MLANRRKLDGLLCARSTGGGREPEFVMILNFSAILAILSAKNLRKSSQICLVLRRILRIRSFNKVEILDDTPPTATVTLGVGQLLRIVFPPGLIDGTVCATARLSVRKAVGLRTGSAMVALELASVPFG